MADEEGGVGILQLLLGGFVCLAVGYGLGLWHAGALDNVAPIWIALGGIIALGVGILLSVSSGKLTVSEDS